jgi:hypothetical protein
MSSGKFRIDAMKLKLRKGVRSGFNLHSLRLLRLRKGVWIEVRTNLHFLRLLRLSLNRPIRYLTTYDLTPQAARHALTATAGGASSLAVLGRCGDLLAASQHGYADSPQTALSPRYRPTVYGRPFAL